MFSRWRPPVIEKPGRGISPDILPNVFEPFTGGGGGLGNGSELVVASPSRRSKRYGETIRPIAASTSPVQEWET